MTTPDPTDRLRATLRELVGDPRDPAATVQVSVALLDEMDAALAAPAPDLLAAVEERVNRLPSPTTGAQGRAFRYKVLDIIAESRSLSTSRPSVADPLPFLKDRDVAMAVEIVRFVGGPSLPYHTRKRREKWVLEQIAAVRAEYVSPSREAGLDVEGGIVQRAHTACCWCGEHHEEGK